ncbi:hypothetical protein [Halobacillus sp. A1]|nr:hypothetical protein [Halobacillus sp. A1]
MRAKRVNKSGSIKKASSEPTIIETSQYRKKLSYKTGGCCGKRR